MHDVVRYGLVALVVLAVVSVGVGEAVRWSIRSAVGTEITFDAERCDGATLSAYEVQDPRTDLDDDDRVAYRDLAPAHRRAFDQARDRDNNTAPVDPTTLSDLPESNETDIERRHLVVDDGTHYRLTVTTDGCYDGQLGPPSWLVPVLLPFVAVDEFVRAFWQHLALVTGLGLGWLAVQRQVRFGP